MDFFYRLRLFFMNLFRPGDEKLNRRSKRHSTIIYISFTDCVDEKLKGNGEVMDINKSGVSLDIDQYLPPGTDIQVRINPHVVQQYINPDQLTQDSKGRFTLRIVWSRHKSDGKGCFCGGAFLALSGEPYTV